MLLVTTKGVCNMSHKYVYLFTEGNSTMRELLGGKGANLADTLSIDVDSKNISRQSVSQTLLPSVCKKSKWCGTILLQITCMLFVTPQWQ